MKLMFLGDIHGNFNIINQYIKLYDIKDSHIIQVGDFGVGFNSLTKEKNILSQLNDVLIKRNIILYAIRGNHDFKQYFDNDPFNLSNIKLLPDYSVLDINNKKILCIGGAVSVDRKYRYTNNQRKGDFTNYGNETWWNDEIFVLDRNRLSELSNISIVVTHTSPHYCFPDNTFGFGPFVEGIIKETGDNNLKTDLLIERQQVTDAFEILKLNNKIEYAFNGHFHKSNFETYDGIAFRLLNINELFELREY